MDTETSSTLPQALVTLKPKDKTPRSSTSTCMGSERKARKRR